MLVSTFNFCRNQTQTVAAHIGFVLSISSGGNILQLVLAAYNLALETLGPALVSVLGRKSPMDPEFKRGRHGFYESFVRPAATPSINPGEGSQKIWFHAASIGEVNGAFPTLRALRRRLPEAEVYLSVGTPQGFRHARSHLPEDVPVFPFPLDFRKCVRRSIESISPDLFVAFETELWPNFYRELSNRRIPALLLNGRLSESSARFYRIARPLFRPVFEHFEWMAMHSEEDANRVREIGITPKKLNQVKVLGSSKFDGLTERALPARASFWKELLGCGDTAPVIVGGSLRGSECFDVMRIFEDLWSRSPGLLGIFAPRHLYNIPEMKAWLSDRSIPCDMLGELESGRRRTAPVVLVDRMGALFEIYSVGDLIFCGGTLVPVGGHNILEPAAWSKPVFYGPHLKKVLHEHRILSNFSGSFCASSAEDLLAQWKEWIEDLDRLKEHGLRAKEAFVSLLGVSERQVDLIQKALERKAFDRG